jgi:hypothetical protein
VKIVTLSQSRAILSVRQDREDISEPEPKTLRGIHSSVFARIAQKRGQTLKTPIQDAGMKTGEIRLSVQEADIHRSPYSPSPSANRHYRIVVFIVSQPNALCQFNVGAAKRARRFRLKRASGE